MRVIVEAMRPFMAGVYEVPAGSRAHALQTPAGWWVAFNGRDVLVPPGTVGEVESVEVKAAAAERLTAREEEYQSTSKEAT